MMATETKTAEIEVWVVVDSDGVYGVGIDQDVAQTDFDNSDGSGPTRLIRLKLTVPLPKVIEVTGTVPNEDGGEVKLTVA